MAHVAKYKISACGRMLNHYQREPGDGIKRSNENIDPERTSENYVIGRGDGIERIRERMDDVRESGGVVRENSAVMFDWVVTAPADLREEDLRDFFKCCFEECRERYGDDNILGGYVHMDETTPHIHIACTPVIERDNGRLSLSAKDLLNRSDLRTFHPDLGDRVEECLGYRPMVELKPEMKLEKSLSKIDGLEEYRQAAERLERLRQDERRLTQENQRLERDFDEARERFRTASETRSQAFEKVETLERERDRAMESVSRLERVRDQLIRGIGHLREHCERLRERVRGLEHTVDRIRESFERTQEKLSDLTSRIDERRGLGDMRHWDLERDPKPEPEHYRSIEYER